MDPFLDLILLQPPPTQHSYYGESLPFPANTDGCMNWLTTEQAMADFAYLLRELKTQYGAENVPVIGFGGSYGGMVRRVQTYRP